MRRNPQQGSLGTRRSLTSPFSTYSAPVAPQAGGPAKDVAKGFASLSRTLSSVGEEQGQQATQELRQLAPAIARMKQEGKSDDQIAKELFGETSRRSQQRLRRAIDKGGIDNIDDPVFNLRLNEAIGQAAANDWMDNNRQALEDALREEYFSMGVDDKVSEDEVFRRAVARAGLEESYADTFEGLAATSPLAFETATQNIEAGLRIAKEDARRQATKARTNVVANGKIRNTKSSLTYALETGDIEGAALTAAGHLAEIAQSLDPASAEDALQQVLDGVEADVAQRVERNEMSQESAAYYLEEIEQRLLLSDGSSVVDRFEGVGLQLDKLATRYGSGDMETQDRKVAYNLTRTRGIMLIEAEETIDGRIGRYTEVEAALSRYITDGTDSEVLQELREQGVRMGTERERSILLEVVRSRKDSWGNTDERQNDRILKSRKQKEDAFMRDMTAKLYRKERSLDAAVREAGEQGHFNAQKQLLEQNDDRIKRNRDMLFDAMLTAGIPKEQQETWMANNSSFVREMLFNTDDTADPQKYAERIRARGKLVERPQVETRISGQKRKAPVAGSSQAQADALSQATGIQQQFVVARDKEQLDTLIKSYALNDAVIDPETNQFRDDEIGEEAHLQMAEHVLFSGQVKTGQTGASFRFTDDEGNLRNVNVRLDQLKGTLSKDELFRLRFSRVGTEADNTAAFGFARGPLSLLGAPIPLTNEPSSPAQRRNREAFVSTLKYYSKDPLSAADIEAIITNYTREGSDD